MGYPYPYFCLCAFWGPYLSHATKGTFTALAALTPVKWQQGNGSRRHLLDEEGALTKKSKAELPIPEFLSLNP